MPDGRFDVNVCVYFVLLGRGFVRVGQSLTGHRHDCVFETILSTCVNFIIRFRVRLGFIPSNINGRRRAGVCRSVIESVCIEF